MQQRWRASVCEPLMSPTYKQSCLGQFNCSPNVLSSLVCCWFQLVLGSRTFVNLCSVYWPQKSTELTMCRHFVDDMTKLSSHWILVTVKVPTSPVNSHSKFWMQLLIFPLYPKIAILLPGNFRINCATIRKKGQYDNKTSNLKEFRKSDNAKKSRIIL